ncbi:cobalt-precorrin 5A hydrolase [Clostridium sp. OS1-26]|uniref:cobalt-precorrin 5A hydrolase n=1 Tax=Clostridium sp. OS1-26 TaxID=3070681 RepID=UPI0027E175F1|nr:cobalt-precorrin 5A hydrolase [Clostridium sp. OS1-26]WML37107.1 cobalt-precorrin 5A hydrolase [Clostridium sp. OS1-26]
MKIAVISVTKSGDVIAEKLKSSLDIELYSKELIKNFSLKEITEKLMKEYKAIIFISSTGIAVRAIAEYIKSKDKDPAIVVVDSSSNFAISLLSGHLGGANELTLQVAKILNSIPVITTATDNLGVEAPDIIAKNNDLIIDNLKDAKQIAALLVNKEKVGFIDLKSKISLPKGYTENFDGVKGLVYVTHNLNEDVYELNNIEKNNKLNEKVKGIDALKLIRKDIVLGIGCRKNFEPEKMRDTVEKLLKEKNIDKRAVKFIGTVEIKKDEEAILKLSEHLGCKVKIFSIEELKETQHKYEGSNFVEKTIGVRAVCEPCVELMGARLVSEKIKANGMTVCIGELDTF